MDFQSKCAERSAFTLVCWSALAPCRVRTSATPTRSSWAARWSEVRPLWKQTHTHTHTLSPHCPTAAQIRCESSRAHLGGRVGLRCLAQQQGGHVGVALLGGEVQGGDPLLGQGVGEGAVAQQHPRHLQLVLLGRDVQRSVAVLLARVRV